MLAEWREQIAAKMHRLPFAVRALIQCLLATGSLATVLGLLNRDYDVVVASIGATAFIVFATPRGVSAKARNVLGGHLIGLLAGALWRLVPHATAIAQELVFSGAVGTAMLVMVLCKVRHPPAAGTALGVALAGVSVDAAVTVLAAIALMVIVERLLRPCLVDLI